MRPIAAQLLGLADGAGLVFAQDLIYPAGRPADAKTFAEVAGAAWAAQVSLAATGYYRTPGIQYDPKLGRGTPFYYFAYGGAVVEVEVNGLTGEHRVLRVDILHDTGDSLIPTVDRGQIEGGYIQGLGWLTTEELIWDPQGNLRTHSPDTYKIPAVGEAPLDFRVTLLDRASQPGVIHGSKAVGEPPLMLAIGVIGALREAIRAFPAQAKGAEVELEIPCTPEAVLAAIDRWRGPASLLDSAVRDVADHGSVEA
jgi:xanthine dehydrogenase large subunit